MPCPDVTASLPHIPPSTETVLCTLHNHTPMTGAQLREETGLPRRTVYAALKQLRELGILRERISLRDSRQTYFWLAGEDPDKLRGPGIAGMFGAGQRPIAA